MHGLMSYRRFGRARSLRSDRAERTLGHYVKPEVVSWSPRIIVLHNFLSSEQSPRPRLQVSTVVDIKTGKGVKSDVRTSSGVMESCWELILEVKSDMITILAPSKQREAPEQILDLYNTRADLRKKDYFAIDNYGDPWDFVGGLPLFDPPRHDSAYTIRRASDLCDQLAISCETRLKLGMGSNVYPYHQLLYLDKKAIRESFGNQVMFF
ncbi:hypothetical protein F2Q68_00033764 [Brassica cretica]|uniref:Uncharacterized protein n=1 Tax=Brassica cretica TaxID=69181 RepID=A0A8S9HB75_BRACR|nr:hypothetical protein F2Q68_00033764 [Brassica cretica]